MSMRKREEIQKVLRGIAPVSNQTQEPVRPVTMAAVQFSASLDRTANIKRALQFAQTAIERGAQLVCFPECFTLPWLHQLDRDEYLELAETIPGPSTEPFLRLAADTGTVFVCPILEIADSRNYFTAVIIGPDGIIGKYRKTHLANVAFWEESEIVDTGTQLPVFDIGFAKIGVLMGWDLFYPEAVRTLTSHCAELIVAPTASALASQSRWLNVLIGHAVCNNCFMLRVNRCGVEGDLEFYGESFCVDPFGHLLEQPTFHRDSVMISEVDMDDVKTARSEFDFMLARRPDLYVQDNTTKE